MNAEAKTTNINRRPVSTIITVKTDDLSHMEIILDAFYREAKDVANGTIYPDAKFDYAIKLISASRRIGVNRSWYWSPAFTVDGMPADARVQLVYKPTYIATAVLMNIYMGLNEIEQRRISLPLKQAMTSCLGRSFEGHGYDAEDEIKEVLNIFQEFNAGDFIAKYPDFNKDFTTLYLSSINSAAITKSKA